MFLDFNQTGYIDKTDVHVKISSGEIYCCTLRHVRFVFNPSLPPLVHTQKYEDILTVYITNWNCTFSLGDAENYHET